MPKGDKQKIDETGNRYGRLVVIRQALPDEVTQKCRRVQWMCKCDCGKTAVTAGTYLRTGKTKSCGCLEKENLQIIAQSHKTHGLAGTSLHRIWGMMIQRCENPNLERYPDYGGRGIKVCQRWRESFQAFAADMGPRPSPKHTLNRKDNDGDYEPSNCVWSTAIEQANNTRANRTVIVRGEKMTLTQAYRRFSVVSWTALWMRIKKGWSIENALLTPPQPGNPHPILQIS